MADGNTDLIEAEQGALAAHQHEELSFAQRVALDPGVDLARLEKVIEMEVASKARAAEQEFNRSLSQMQTELPAVEAGGTGHQNAKYGKLEHIQAAVRPVLANHGFAVRFKVHDGENELSVECILSHKDGHSDSDRISLPYDTSGSKNNVQARGSTVSYGKRYTLCNILNIQIGGMDDDGGGGLPPVETITEEQENELHALLTDNDCDVAKFLAVGNIASLADIEVKNFAAARAMIEKVIAQKAAQS